MAFIGKTQILEYLEQTSYDDIAKGLDTIIDGPIARAESLIREYLGNRYDIDVVFGDPTNIKYITLRQCCVDLAIYYLYNGNVSPRHVPEFRVMNYETSCDLLKKYGRGEIGDSLPEITAAEGEAREKAVTSYRGFIDTAH